MLESILEFGFSFRLLQEVKKDIKTDVTPIIPKYNRDLIIQLLFFFINWGINWLKMLKN